MDVQNKFLCLGMILFMIFIAKINIVYYTYFPNEINANTLKMLIQCGISLYKFQKNIVLLKDNEPIPINLQLNSENVRKFHWIHLNGSIYPIREY